MFFVIVVVVLIFLIFIGLYCKELLCSLRNPFPLFHNGDKRFREIVKYQTRSILKDIHYDI